MTDDEEESDIKSELKPIVEAKEIRSQANNSRYFESGTTASLTCSLTDSEAADTIGGLSALAKEEIV